jgi:hypothetical protein
MPPDSSLWGLAPAASIVVFVLSSMLFAPALGIFAYFVAGGFSAMSLLLAWPVFPLVSRRTA